MSGFKNKRMFALSFCSMRAVCFLRFVFISTLLDSAFKCGQPGRANLTFYREGCTHTHWSSFVGEGAQIETAAAEANEMQQQIA